MTLIEILVLVGIVSAFVGFGLVLAWGVMPRRGISRECGPTQNRRCRIRRTI